MNKQEIINKLATKTNFKTLVDICLSEGLEIEQYESYPEINVYHHHEDKNTKLFDDNWTQINPHRDKFVVNGEILSGITNFFKHYKDITKFIITSKETKTILRVIPNVIVDHWSTNYEHQEIGYDCHSYSDAAFEVILIRVPDEKIQSDYYVDGSELEYTEWIIESREFKLSRILNIDIKKERLEKERLEKEKREKLERERLEKEKREKLEREKTYNWFVVNSDNSNITYLA